MANATILANESISSASLVGSALCPGRVCLCGSYHSPWAHDCLDSCAQPATECLLGYLTVLQLCHKLTKLPQWPTPLELS